ncbi:sigma-70 family RNA polymerase sigma factor [Enterocloster bolteae]|uniref:sigma-70 family RNA polymerase sigma factor n=1 Tax=Enterocloster bolteae TaxID=208479 RepID=UPI00210AE0EA|nr:sigma-70 family RNA polymerase sigma factor [Enterocloster bolteae]MCQ5144439.1 sigma-70 family RNA polymerase sigma factor [Enterocloster bolteae]
MAKPNRIPDFKKMYPEASEEVIAVLKTTERKMQYQEYDLKVEQTIVDQEKQRVTVIPSREDSYERLLEQNTLFVEDGDSVEETAIQNIQFQQLHKALSMLSEDDRVLMEQIFFEGRTERELALEYQISQKGINKRRQRILGHLRELLENF